MSQTRIELTQLDDISRLQVARESEPLTLSQMLPVLTAMGIEVLSESVTVVAGAWSSELAVRLPGRVERPDLLADALAAAWEGRAEVDRFNALVVSVGLTWHEVALLRAWARFLRLGASPFTASTVEGAVVGNPVLARNLVELFKARCDPALSPAERDRRTAVQSDGLRADLDAVVSLDDDRILRSMAAVVEAITRTNWFQRVRGEPAPYLAFKIASREIPDLPEPRPERELFVYSPRFEGVHLRFGAVARGGIRWSDRRDDFRTEVLGLVKAQEVKNAVIVPVGAKGGFSCKRLPDPSQREAWLAEGRACYGLFIEAMLSLTDNLTPDGVVPPADVVRHDDDDAYLVVAADKGTAEFSDLANEIAQAHGFWLGDAFAAGGSHGYDHKAMGITARGAWESTRRHLREIGIDAATQDFTVVGIGDMSGDVFGNGLLQSPHIRLVAAFDHRDIFVDPRPDPAASYAERKRLFALPRSSWRDYDVSLISAGGGVFPRSAKAIRLSPQMKGSLSIDPDVVTMTPADLIHAILQAPVDVLFNGGVGTYVKAQGESHLDVADKANDAVRVNGSQVRARVAVEGGNLGFTQRGRVEYARYGDGVDGGRITADFIDNSAGVDTSDREVNIKILLAGAQLGEADRDDLLQQMRDEVGAQAVRANYLHNVALSCVVGHAPGLLHVHSDWIDVLEHAGLLDPALEALPTHKQIADRKLAGEGLSQPELAVLFSYTKIGLAHALNRTGIADEPFTHRFLDEYFPSLLRERYPDLIATHPLRRELIVSELVNELVNEGDMTFVHRLTEETGASTADLVRANVIAKQLVRAADWFAAVEELDGRVAPGVQVQLRIGMRTLTERISRWLILYRRRPLAVVETVEAFADVPELLAVLPTLLTGVERRAFERRAEEYAARGVPTNLAVRAAAFPPSYAAMTAADTARREKVDPVEVANLHFALGERLGLPDLVQRILVLPRPDRWHSMARAAVREDLHAVHGQLTAEVLTSTSAADTVEQRIAEWEGHRPDAVARAAAILDEVTGSDDASLAPLSVCVRELRTLLTAS